MSFIYHVTTKQAWNAAQENGYYTTHSLETEGFIHCSEAQQVEGVLQRYYQGQTDLIKLVIDPQKLQYELKYEMAPSINEKFPHVYGPINFDSVVDVVEIKQSV